MKIIKQILLAAIITFVFISCNFGPMGIFKSLEVESQLDDGPLSNDLSVGSFVKKGDTYYIGAGLVYKRDTGDDTWEKYNSPEDNYICLEIAIIDSRIYAVFYNTDGTDFRLYYISGDGFNRDDELKNKNVMNLLPVVDASGVTKTLFTTVKSGDYAYQLYYRTDSSDNFSKCSIEGSSDDEVSHMISDAALYDSKIWIVSGNTIYFSTDNGDSFQIKGDTPDSEAKYEGLYYAPTLDALFLSTIDGKVFGYKDGSWGDAGKIDGGETYRFYDMTELPVGSDSHPDRTLLIVGSSNGYYEAVFNETPVESDDLDDIDLQTPGLNSYSTSENYLNTELSVSVVTKLYIDTEESSSDPPLFACTLVNGIWRNEKEGGKRIWNRE
jgi:hypothetical protein